MAQQPITHLDELDGKPAREFKKLYIDNIEFIDKQEEAKVRKLLMKRNLNSTLQHLRSALRSKVANLIPNHAILKKDMKNDKTNTSNDIIALTPLSFISKGTIPTNNDKGGDTPPLPKNVSEIEVSSTTTPEITEEVMIVGTSTATASGCLKCGKTDNSAKVAELEQEIATLKEILVLAAASPNCGDACKSKNTTQLEQRVVALEQKYALIEQWTVPSLAHKGTELNKLLVPSTTSAPPPTAASKLPLTTVKGKKSNETPPETTPPVAAPSTNVQLPQAQDLPTPSGPRPEISQNVKKADLYIANCESTYNRDKLRAHINSSTGVSLDLSDIIELNTNNSGKAFKVSVPEDIKDAALEIWLPGIKAEPYGNRKPGTAAGRKFKSVNGGNRGKGNTFHGPNTHTSNKLKNSHHNGCKNQKYHKKPQWSGRRFQNHSHRRDLYQQDDYQEQRPYRTDDYQEQRSYQRPVNYGWRPSYQQPERRYNEHPQDYYYY